MAMLVVYRRRRSPPGTVYSPLDTHLTNRKWKPSESDVHDVEVQRFKILMNGQINIHVSIS